MEEKDAVCENLILSERSFVRSYGKGLSDQIIDEVFLSGGNQFPDIGAQRFEGLRRFPRL